MNKLQEAIAKLEADMDRSELNERLLQMLQEKIDIMIIQNFSDCDSRKSRCTFYHFFIHNSSMRDR